MNGNVMNMKKLYTASFLSLVIKIKKQTDQNSNGETLQLETNLKNAWAQAEEFSSSRETFE